MEFPTNLLISGKSSSKIFFTETEDTVSESVLSSEIISFQFLEIVQDVLREVTSVLIFKLESIFFNNFKSFRLGGFELEIFIMTG